MAARGKLWGLFLQLIAVLSLVPGEQGLDLRCLQSCNVKGDLSCFAKCAAERSRRSRDADYPQSGPCQPWPFSGHNLPYVPASPTDLREVGRSTGDCRVNGVDMQCEGVTVEWKAAAQGIRDLRGFQASILRPGINNCYQVILPESVVADGETIYNHTFFPIFPGDSYSVSIYSLPMNYDSSNQAPPARIDSVTPRTCTEVNSVNPWLCGPEAWVPPTDINITVTGRSVDANFPVAPNGYGINAYFTLIVKMICDESEFNCETWVDTCNGDVAIGDRISKPPSGTVVRADFDLVPPGKYLFEVRAVFGKRTCPTFFEVSDWAPPVDSITVTEDKWNCSAVVSFPPDDDVPSYRVCMDEDCASLSYDSGTSVRSIFQSVQPYHEYQVKVSDGRYADAANTTKSFTTMQGFTPNITDVVITQNDDSYGLSVTFKSPRCIQEYAVNVCQTSGMICLQLEETYTVKAAYMESALEGVTKIELPPAQPTNPPTTSDSTPTVTSPTYHSNDSWKYGAAAGGVAAAVTLVIILLYCWKHPRRIQLPKICSDTDNNFQPGDGRYYPSDNTLTASLPDIRQKTVLLLPSYDCEEHKIVVLSFAAYLQRECHCQVILDLHKAEDISKLGAMEWLVSHIHGVDYVVVICSVGTKFKATKDKKARQLQEIEPCGDLFTGGLKHINLLLHSRGEDMSKFINVYFPYSKKTDVPATLEIARTFKLMESMPALFCHIHGHPQYSMEGAAHIDIAERVGSTESGRNLLSAIAKMEAKDAAEPDWFLKRIVNTTESDSGHGSFSKASTNNNHGNINPSDKGEETSAKAPADVNVTVDDEAKVYPEDEYGDEDDGYCPSIPMSLLNNGTVEYDFQPQPDAFAYLHSGLPELYVPADIMVEPPGPPYQPYQQEPVQFAPYGCQQDLDGWQPPYEGVMNNQQVPHVERTPRPNLKLHIPEPYLYPPQGLHVPQEPNKEAITPESGCFSGESIEDQLSLFNQKMQEMMMQETFSEQHV
ncbi:IL17RD [Branchiostoma lanceolatum]|uniref:IL17RD protein n=1 Tax=Branchiostoma lanceolatum TaxID=7740 RepID=A0A8J9ZZE8_BRALA|nr:IL17RD [Branchiostoma lanceolatum]